MKPKPNILFMVHVEEMFRQYFPDSMYLHRILRAYNCRKYSRVWFLESHIDNDGLAGSLENRISREDRIEWSWGYEKDMFNDEEREWIIPACGHVFTWVPPELREMLPILKEANVFVGGGSEYECLLDWCDCLDYLDINYQKIQGYIF